MPSVSSGVAELDSLLGGLVPGDNIVWIGSDHPLLASIEESLFEQAGRDGAERIYVTASASPASLRRRLGEGTAVLDARRGHDLADPVLLEQTLLERARGGARVIVESLDAFAPRWGRERTLALFSRLCPQFFDIGAVAYWRGTRQGLGSGFLDEVQKVTQCVLEVGGGHLKVLKAEGRPEDVQGRLLKIHLNPDGTVHLERERALGRLGEGLRRLRGERALTQGDLARLAGVSPSAISQAEAGHRGLGLETLLTLSEALGVGVDDLLANRRDDGYVVARRERLGRPEGRFALLDDPAAGLRAYLVQLRPGERATPPRPHKGVELVLVASGLVQVDVGTATPVLRAGDALLATRAGILAWRNLLAEPARMFWILRD